MDDFPTLRRNSLDKFRDDNFHTCIDGLQRPPSLGDTYTHLHEDPPETSAAF